jgi:hypothetical protein
MRPNYARRSARRGKGLIPPNPNHWDVEHNGLDLRDDLGLAYDVKLPTESAFEQLADVIVMPHGELPCAQMYVDHFRDSGRKAWSGMGITLPDGLTYVVFNDSHPPSRIRATLMEEFFHLKLGHPTTSVRIYGDSTAKRTHNPAVESQAYGSGAAALVPYVALRLMLEGGHSVGRVARLFEVSPDLVIFRTKVTKLYRLLGRRSR